MTNTFKKIIFATAAMTVFAIGSFAQNSDIASVQWKLTHLNGKPAGENRAYIEIDPAAGRFTGNTGCNRMFGTVKITGRNISFSGVGATKMACIPPNGTVEGGFLKALEQATRYSVGGNVLNVYAGNWRILKFKKSREGTSQSGLKLEDKKWVLDTIGSKPVAAIGKTAFVSFDAQKGSAGGNTSCNVYGGEYTAKGNSISIKQMISTMRACIEDERMSIERSFLDGLREAERFEIKGEKLYLYKGSELLLTFHGENK
jgi:heat shock protein HslJ